jgi:protein-S-isoprenylcysteine O-methyltransferase Ste14
MEWIPEISIGWLNGWIPLALLALTDGILFLVFPKEVVTRLFDRSGWTQRQVVFTVIGKLCALVCLVMLILSPLKIGSGVFIVGIVVVVIGLSGLAKALFDFRNTPLGEPVSQGLYTLSRHPQIVMSSVVLLGGCIAIGSWLATLMLLLARIFSHFGILAEEEICLQQYGEAYQSYMERVPRYFVFF